MHKRWLFLLSESSKTTCELGFFHLQSTGQQEDKERSRVLHIWRTRLSPNQDVHKRRLGACGQRGQLTSETVVSQGVCDCDS